MKICLKQHQQQSKTKKTTTKKSFPLRTPDYSRALSIAPCQVTVYIRVKLTIFNIFTYEILPVDAIWSW